MATGLTQAQMRDQIRRYIQVVPYIDYPSPGAVGALPPLQPDPNNATLNQIINESIAAINRAVRVGAVTRVNLAVPMADANDRGVNFIDISGAVTNTLTASEVFNVIFSDGFVTQRLERWDYYAKDKDYTAEQMYPPGTPVQFVLIGAEIGIAPPPATDGRLYFQYIGAIPPLVNDGDTVAYLPVDYQTTILYWAVALLSARQATDVEAAQRFTDFLPLAQNGLLQIYAWKNGYDREAIQALRDTISMIPLNATLRALAAAQTLGNETGQSQQGQQ